MTTSELITPAHLARKALIYVRQSTLQQVLTNQESLHLQYALRLRALELGWRPEDIEIIDCDLGQTAAVAQNRAGFKEVVSRVTLGEVGILLSSEVTRLSRNCSDWYPLLDICGYRQCLIADRDGIYDPASTNGRLLLGLKGQLSEFELHTIRSRLTAGLLNKAERGDLGLPLPMGLLRLADGQVVKDPNVEVQERLGLVFSTFLRVKSASQVLRFFNEQQLTLPRRDRFGDVVWKPPTVAALLAILKNPTYAGAFVYGRSQTSRDGTGKSKTKRAPFNQWKIIVQDKYPAYLSWETFERIQAMLQDNYAEYERNKTRGVPRAGATLLHGLVYCGECGHKMMVQYKGGPEYLCLYLRQQYQVPVCQRIPAQPIDDFVVQAFFQALSPIELEVYEQTLKSQAEIAHQVCQAQAQQVERLRYQAALAQRQYNQVDPDNRLVAAELERRWETALTDLQQAEEMLALQHREADIQPELPTELKTAFAHLAQQLPEIWDQEELVSTPHKKALLRCLIDKVVIHRLTPDQIQTRIVWKGGETTSTLIPVTVGSFSRLSTAAEMETTILELSQQGQSDEAIAAYLTERGWRSPKKLQVVLPSTVKSIRLKHRLFQKRSQSHPRHIPGFLTVPQLAQTLQVSPYWLYHYIDCGKIDVKKDPQTGLYLFPDQPDTLNRFQQFKAGTLQNLRF
ncbi:MAG: recombinase family protein [Anaerolineales bacterium]|nr:recombinase family protein [Anaerolineales bacterium]